MNGCDWLKPSQPMTAIFEIASNSFSSINFNDSDAEVFCYGAISSSLRRNVGCRYQITWEDHSTSEAAIKLEGMVAPVWR
jgi:hypothetical protein